MGGKKLTSLSKKQNGFTVIELFIVIIVIAVLSYLIVTTYASIQARSRNNTRQNDIKLLQSAIEFYYSQNGYYPNLNDVNSAAWRDKNMKNLNDANLVDPSSSCNPSTSACLGGKSYGVKDQYQYYVTESDGVTGCNGKVGSTADQYCAQYKLIATYEGSFNGQHYDILQNIN